MELDLTTLPNFVKLEVTKEALLAFANQLRSDKEAREVVTSDSNEEELLSFEEMSFSEYYIHSWRRQRHDLYAG
ncbi:MAG: hypothetical protein MI974_20845 [Chitinophagales bacterium]|nr:hypothetical protein [Chitinophagales bacterium]